MAKAKVSLKTRKENLAALLEQNTGKELTPELVSEIKAVFGAGHVSTKVNEEGLVYCNYFDTYLPKEEFGEGKKGKIDSMSTAGKKLFRTQKSMVNKATSTVLKNYREKTITADEMDVSLATIQKNAEYRYPQGTDAVNADYPFAV